MTTVYRLDSLTSVVSKLVKSTLRDGINCHVERHGLVRNGQHRFDKGMSSLTNLIEFFAEVTRMDDERSAMNVCTWGIARRLTRSHMA